MKVVIPLILSLSLLMTGCGKPEPQLYIASVDFSLVADFDDLRAHVNYAAGHEVISLEYHEAAYTIQQPTAENFVAGVGSNPSAWGITITRKRLILIAPAGVPFAIDNGGTATLSEGAVKYVLAHELGHALGLQHTDHGIMQPGFAVPECIDHESACLVAALREGGVL